VGVLAVPRRGDSRVSRGLDRLLQAGRVGSLAEVVATGRMPPPQGRLQEADRVAEYILNRLQTQDPSAPDESAAGVAQPK
jgi:hypothetical protein